MSLKPEEKININNSKKMKNKNVLVTGSTSGIGKQVAFSFARLGCNVYIHGRSQVEGEKVSERIKDMGTSSKFFACDFSSQSDVKNFSDTTSEFFSSNGGLDILVNNAGGYFRNVGKTEDGIEYTFAVNHLSHFILTRHFIPMLNESNYGEIINVSSSAHKSGNMDLSNIEGENVSNGMSSYARSKLANIHFTKCLNKRLEDSGYDINVNAIHPGGIPSSGFLRSIPGPLYKIGKKLGKLPIFDQPEDGAATILYACLSNETREHSGNYYADLNKKQPNDLAQNEDIQEKLWQKSVDLTDTDWEDIF